ncbi:hypothetical protein GGI25_004100 [Coemansia spiralis]|uniref:Uncharacterized protein n=2 Tax=Coemansia TaxID=4863 RepID=A0A9W8KXP7_9FUNG|nr:hypothetical protein BX070DRAFT_228724 [Coemansia spiralis]KAJ1990639.1 hypothetical protein EDC05_003954 [Coemansia umbellata]KAJ2622384.1 hypothetical protein GGI26_003247 [Coemansia sp. RSA 1358]KAJ2675051.1 hypothetical protein GGI25_004100 [Coemansia spiralis]
MDGIWLQFSGFPYRTTHKEIDKFTRNKPLVLDKRSINKTEDVGLMLMKDMDDALFLLRDLNYTKLNGSVAKFSMVPADLAKYTPIVIKLKTARNDTEEKLFMHCKQYGNVCGIKIEKNVAEVWLDTKAAATSAFNNLGNSELFSNLRLEHAIEASNKDSNGTPMEVIVLDDKDNVSASGNIHTIADDSDSNSSMISVDMLKPANPFSLSHIVLDAPSLKHGSANQSASNDPGNRKLHLPLVPRRQAGNRGRKSTGRHLTASKQWFLANQAQLEMCNGSIDWGNGNTNSKENVSSSVLSANGDINGDLDKERLVQNFVDMESWRAKAPFIYNSIYRRVPERGTIKDGHHCLSMVWSLEQNRNVLSLYLSQGNMLAVRCVQSWRSDANSILGSKSEVTMSSFQIPARGMTANLGSLLNTFNGKAATIMHKNRQNNWNEYAVSSLKLHDDGHVLFGCGAHNVMMWSADEIKHKGSLMLLSDVDGVYDVGCDYVVANSTKGEMGVWKRGSSNYLWRYNDTRRFRALPSQNADAHVITALQIAKNGAGAYVGDLTGSVSFSDFRQPYIHQLASVCNGASRNIATVGDYGIIVGTDSGYLGLLDTRFVRAQPAKIEVVREYNVPKAASITQLRVCPHDPNVFACSVERNVYIFKKEGQIGSRAPLFCHHAHHSQVVDFNWHPGFDHKYTIGSVESGEGYDSGEIQIWEPTSLIL